MPQKPNFLIYPFDTIFQTSIPYSWQHTAITLFNTKYPRCILISKSELETSHLSYPISLHEVWRSVSSPPFFSTAQLLSIYRGLVRPRLEYASHVWGGIHALSSFLDRVESSARIICQSVPSSTKRLSERMFPEESLSNGRFSSS